MYHKSVLLRESVDALAINPDGIYVDVTFGGGGHSAEIIKRLRYGRLIAFDQDEEALANHLDDERFTLIHSNFRFLRNFLKFHHALPVHGILADLGVSGHQIDQAHRGFSTRFEGKPDMRMDVRKELTAEQVINHYPEEKLLNIFIKYGEIENAKKLTTLIINERKEKRIESTTRLNEIAAQCAPRGKEFQFAAQVFQALRIEVNQELAALEEFLKQATEVLAPSGRIVVISYHSLEDKLVKNWFKTGNTEGILHKDFYGNQLVPLKQLISKAIKPSDEEIKMNNRARSARMRVAEKRADG